MLGSVVLLELSDRRPGDEVAESDGGEGDDGEVDALEVRHVLAFF